MPIDYTWPLTSLVDHKLWQPAEDPRFIQRPMPENADELANDSRWPAFFPAPICLVTTVDGDEVLLEKVVGASVVNRFPYTVALSFCRDALSDRHYVRRDFMDALEKSGIAAVQFISPGSELDRAMDAILTIPQEKTRQRIASSRLPWRRGRTNAAPVFSDAYMAYECSLVTPGRDFDGQNIFPLPYTDVGSHRVFFLEINSIQLRQDIARGDSQISWRGLPLWAPQGLWQNSPQRQSQGQRHPYVKGYTPHYRFPGKGTTAFEYDGVADDMAFKDLPALPEDQVEVDNDRARWPCFFPSPVGMITSYSHDGSANIMPCGSTTILSRQPLVVAPAVSYARINARYAPRASLDDIRASGRFGCGVPFIDDTVIDAIRYAGNVSIRNDADKTVNAGLEVIRGENAPILAGLPVHFDCEVIGEIRLGTHILFLGEVRRILVRADVSPDNPLTWRPWAMVEPAS